MFNWIIKMADIYTKIRDGLCGPGGLKCFCCNSTPHRGKNKKESLEFLKDVQK